MRNGTLTLVALCALAVAAFGGQTLAAQSTSFSLFASGNPCIAGRCTLSLEYEPGDGSVTVAVDWTHTGAASSGFHADDSVQCDGRGDDDPSGRSRRTSQCGLQSPPMEFVGRNVVAIKVTGDGGGVKYAGKSVTVVTNIVAGAHPAPIRKASHVGWPTINGLLLINKLDGSRPLDARGGEDPFDRQDPTYKCDGDHNYQGCFLISGACLPGPGSNSCKDDPVNPLHSVKHNELLGAHGSETIHAGDAGDVIWGDYKPTGQPRSQRDRLFGGNGRDFIYTSWGHNEVHTGGGADIIHAHDGGGDIYCDSPNAIVYMSHSSRKHYVLHNCPTVSYKPAGTAVQ